MKRIINGVTYDTTTATEIFFDSNDHSEAWWGLYQTRHGAFFKVLVGHHGDEAKWTPLTDEEARAHVEKFANHLVGQFFGSAPEAGSAERRMTIRIPVGLARRVETAATAKGLTFNRYVMKSLEKTLAQEPPAGPVAGR
jgi:predicted DNA binding CopG/RHH family protein